jgi:hypothetical protein
MCIINMGADYSIAGLGWKILTRYPEVKTCEAGKLTADNLCILGRTEGRCTKDLSKLYTAEGDGQKSTNLESRQPYRWAKGFMPSLNRPMVRVEQTYGVAVPALAQLCQATMRKIPPWKRKRSLSRNRRQSNPMGQLEYWVPVPKSAEDAYRYDQQNCNDLWEKAIKEEIQAIIDSGTFKFLDPGECIPKGYQEACLMTIYWMSSKTSVERPGV